MRGPDLNVPLDFDAPYHEVFFKHFWPDMTGKAKTTDKYYSNQKADMYETMQKRNIKFHDPKAEDPDWKMKQYVLLLIAAATEVENGLVNLWKSGATGGCRNYPDFGKYAEKNEFNAFMNALLWMWSHERYWYEDKRDVPWEMFIPFLDVWNTKARELFDMHVVVLDESMIGWRPKTSKLGGLPNYMFEPRNDAAKCSRGSHWSVNQQ